MESQKQDTEQGGTTPPPAPTNTQRDPVLPPLNQINPDDLPPVDRTAPSRASVFPNGRSKKPLIAALAVLIALVGGGVAGAMWWTSPQKTFDDATNAEALPRGGTVSGALEIKTDQTPGITVDYTTKYNLPRTLTDMTIKADAGMMNFKMTGGFASTADSIMFRVNDVRKTINAFAGDNTQMVDKYYGSLISKIDGKWVAVTADDLKEASKDSGTDMSCVMATLPKLSDKTYYAELKSLYEKHKYVSYKDTSTTEKINNEEAIRYTVAIDEKKVDSYMQASRETKFMKELRGCITSEEDRKTFDKPSESAKDDTPMPKIELWITKWSHKPVKFLVSQDKDGTNMKFSGVMTYNDAQPVETPKAETKFKDIQKEIDSVQKTFETPETQLR